MGFLDQEEFVRTRRLRRRDFQSRTRGSTLPPRSSPRFGFLAIDRMRKPCKRSAGPERAPTPSAVAIPTRVSLSVPEGRTLRSGPKETTPLAHLRCWLRGANHASTDTFGRLLRNNTTTTTTTTTKYQYQPLGDGCSHAGTRPLCRCSTSKILIRKTKQSKGKGVLCSSLTGGLWCRISQVVQREWEIKTTL